MTAGRKLWDTVKGRAKFGRQMVGDRIELESLEPGSLRIDFISP
jgi:hypothetical protein